MRTLSAGGTPRAIGRAIGESFREEVHHFYRLRLDNAIEQARIYGRRTVGEPELLLASKRCLEVVQGQFPSGYEELTGIAEGAALTTEQVWAMNNLTDLRDLAAFGAWSDGEIEGCSSIVSVSTEGKVLAAQTWDLASDNMPFVCVIERQPDHAKRTVSLSTVGCLSLIAMSEDGLCVGTTNLRTTDVQPGVGYLDVLHAAVQADTLEHAQSIIENAPRAAGHYYWVISPKGGLAVSCSAQRSVGYQVLGPHVQCNHALEAPIVEVEAKNTPMTSSYARQARLTELTSDGVTLPSLKAAMADTQNGENAIVRRDYSGISTNAAVVVDPDRRQFWAVHGPPAPDTTWSLWSL